MEVKNNNRGGTEVLISFLFLTVVNSCEGRNLYRVLVGKPEGRRPLGRPRRRWDDEISMEHREIGWGVCGVDSRGSG
jgi:hypothetical protein